MRKMSKLVIILLAVMVLTIPVLASTHNYWFSISYSTKDNTPFNLEKGVANLDGTAIGHDYQNKEDFNTTYTLEIHKNNFWKTKIASKTVSTGSVNWNFTVPADGEYFLKVIAGSIPNAYSEIEGSGIISQ